MRIFTFDEEVLSHFLFTSMGKRALLGAAGAALAIVGTYYLYQQYQAQPEQKSESETPVPDPQQPSPDNEDTQPTTATRLTRSLPNTDPGMQEPLPPDSPQNTATQKTFSGKNPPLPLSDFFEIDHEKLSSKRSAHSTTDPENPDTLLVHHGSDDDVTQQAFRR